MTAPTDTAADLLRVRLIAGWIDTPDPRTPIAQRTAIIHEQLDKIQHMDTLLELPAQLDMNAVRAMYPTVAAELDRWGDLNDEFQIYRHWFDYDEPYDPQDATEYRMEDPEDEYLAHVAAEQQAAPQRAAGAYRHMQQVLSAFGGDPRADPLRQAMAADAEQYQSFATETGPAPMTDAEQVRALIAQRPLEQLEESLDGWAAGRGSAAAAFAFAQVVAELEPLEDPAVSLDPDPDDLFGPPAFEGLASQAFEHLVPGDYRVQTTVDGQDGVLRVTDTASALISPPTTAEALTTAAQFPNPAATRTPEIGDNTMTSPGPTEPTPVAPPAVPQQSAAATAAPDPAPAETRRAPAAPPLAPKGIRVTINGNLAAEPAYGVTDEGKAWARLRVASNERTRGADSTWKDAPPEYTQVVVFGAAADKAVNTLAIGDPVVVKGRPEVEMFTRRDGEPAAALKVFASSVTPNTHIAPTAGPQRAVEQQVDQPPATIRHTPESTVAVGVGRDDKALQGVLKDHGFKWSAKHTSWYLPTTMTGDQRTAAVSEIGAAANDRGLPLAIDDGADTPIATGPQAGGFDRTPDHAARTSPDIGH